ncbi:MAG: sensor histidine kinase, partial [Phycisphaerales bacterium]|nr:sensor histidine kinase [Phycisphaerales bacterium]
YNREPQREWERLEQDPYHSLEFTVTMHHLRRHLPAGSRILDAGGGPASTELLATGINDIWSIGSSDSKLVALFTASQLKGVVQDVCGTLPKLRGGGITVRYNPAGKDEPNAFISEPIGKQMPGWRISLFLRKPAPFQAAADRQRIIYIITASVAIGMILLIAAAITRHTRRETKLTQLKNDLMSAVSSELKTPTESTPVLVDNFHIFSHMECDQCDFEFVELQVAGLVDQALQAAGERFSRTHAYLKIDIEPDLPPIVGDPDALVTVIMNLLDNAWQYSRDNREIRIKAVMRGKFVCLKIIDNGIGMAPRVVRRIFNRFHQAKPTPASSGRCGLGLHIAKFIIDAHGGAIEVVSHPSVGSTFIVKLPISRA